MNLDAISSWFESLGVPPVLGGFLFGVLFMLIIFAGKREKRQPDSASRIQAFVPDKRPAQQHSSIKVDGPAIAININGREIEIPADEGERIIEMIRGNRTIEAIKTVRARSDLGLAEAKQFVEMLERQMPRR
jgi:hypothetical protein